MTQHKIDSLFIAEATGFGAGLENVIIRHMVDGKSFGASYGTDDAYTFAEHNVLYNAALRGLSTSGATMYVARHLEENAIPSISKAGITRVVCLEPNCTDETVRLLETYGISLTIHKDNK